MKNQSGDFSFTNGENNEIIDIPKIEEMDFYSFLNLSSSASSDEIQIAYKKFSRLYHPDKHSQDPSNYTAAQSHFNKIKEAYDILSDVNKRAYYDQYGMKGVEMHKWEVVARTQRPEEIGMIYESRQRIVEDERLNRITRPDSGMTLGFDLTDVFDRYLKEESSEHYLHPSINIHKAELRQAVCLGMTSNDTVNLIGSCSTKNGIGKGQLTATWRKLLYPKLYDTWIDFQISLSTDSDVSGGIILSRRIWDKVRLRLGGTLVMPRFGTIAPGVVSSFNWQISDHLFGEVEYKWNLDSQLYTRMGWQSHNGNHGLDVGVKLSGQDTYLTLYYNYLLSWGKFFAKMSNHNYAENDEWSIDERIEPVKLKIGGRYGIKSVYGELGISRRITKFSSFGISLSVGVPLGVLAKFKIIRGNQTFVFPLVMSEKIDAAATFYGSLVPITIFFAVKNLLYDPWKKKELDLEISKRRQNFHSELKRRRDEAYSAQSLISETAKRSNEQEKDKNGLIIKRAVYGKLTSTTRGDHSSSHSLNEDPVTQETIDVTIPLQVLIERSKLHLSACRPGFTRGQLQGFYDPCLGLISTVGTAHGPNGDSSYTAGVNVTPNRRQLYVRYEFLNFPHEIVVSDQEELAIPMERHRIN